MVTTRHPKILVGKITPCPKDKLSHMLERLRLLSSDGQEQELRVFLNDLLPEARLAGVSVNSASDNGAAQMNEADVLVATSSSGPL